MSRPRSPAIVLAVARQNSAAALAALAALLDGQPGLLFASAGREAAPLELPSSGGVTASTGDLDHLIATRFPAAWNVRRAAENGCGGRKVTVIVPDFYFDTPSNFAEQLEASFSFDRTSAEPTAFQTPQPHGFRVVGSLAAKFDALLSTGANPAPVCLQLRLVNGRGLTLFQVVDATITAVKRDLGPVIVSSSVGYNLFICGPSGNDTCAATDVAAAAPALRTNLRDHFAQGIVWAAFAMDPNVVGRMLVIQAAGNDADKLLGRVYGGLRSARLGSPFAIATTLAEIDTVATAPALWSPASLAGTPIVPAPVDLSLDSATIGALKLIRDATVSHPITDRNLLLVGAATNEPQLADLRRTAFSNDGAALFAVGQGISTVDLSVVEGTSYSAPQVAGLASYLWLLEPMLATQPVAVTIALLRAAVQSNGTLADIVDAYAAVLSLDQAAAPTPASARIRLALLDADGDDDFDLADLQAFRDAYVDSGVTVEPGTQDYSRFDLNGDGFTGGSRTTRMDLDPTGSTRFGAPALSEVFLELGGADAVLDEHAVTDAQALCFYAHSALYTGGDAVARDEALGGLCGEAPGVTIEFVGPVTLEAVTQQPGLTLRKRFDLVIEAEIEGGRIMPRAISGSGSETYTYAPELSFSCGGVPTTNRPPETTSGTASSVSGLGIDDGDVLAQPVIVPRFDGTKVTNFCSDGVWTSVTQAFSNDSLGSFVGTVEVIDNRTVAIDFNADVTDAFGQRTVTTGRLVRNTSP